MLYMNLWAHEHPFIRDVEYVNNRDKCPLCDNMSVDLIGKRYSLANKFSLRIMNRVHTHPGHVNLVPDQEMAKIHNDSVKQFIGLAATCQSLIKHKHDDGDEAPRFPHRNPSGMPARHVRGTSRVTSFHESHGARFAAVVVVVHGTRFSRQWGRSFVRIFPVRVDQSQLL
ncbi:hypothetical protein CRENBAI_010566 [Crenichthys baileyi]|uniref:Uncharacterized protein n=1 Tax=Crenichthys baileyi TaxID=28760 RepID=A0AAV9SBL5_9TELE